MTSDTPNASAQASLKRKKGKARVIMKIAGVLVELPVKKAPHTHKGFTVLEHRQKVTCSMHQRQHTECLKVHCCGVENFDQTQNQLDLNLIHATHALSTGVQMRSNSQCDFTWMTQ